MAYYRCSQENNANGISQALSTCVVIIDCFEIFVDRPTDLLARAQTYSQYKHHNTVKYLIGITPQGTVSYISEGWGGRTSDKYVTEHCSLLSNLVPGDTVQQIEDLI